MRKYIIIPLAMLTAVSCGWKDKEVKEDTLTRLSQAAETNYVDTMTLRLTDFRRQTVSNGRLMAVRKSALRFNTSGTISEVRFVNGQSVREGELIASLDPEAASIALAQAGNALKKAEIDLNDALIGFGYGDADTSDVPEAVMAVARTRSGYSSARNSLDKAEFDYEGTTLKAPFSGIVADVAYRKYDMTGSDPLCTLIDDRSFDVDFMVLESEYPNVSVGMDVKVIPFGTGGRVAYGKVISVNPAVDRNGQVLVRARLANDGSFVDGMNVKVTVERPVPGRLVVPKSAVVIRDNQYVLFRYSKGRAKWTYVNVLMSNSGDYAVEANLDRGAELAEGDTVIVSGNLNIADDSEVVVKAE